MVTTARARLGWAVALTATLAVTAAVVAPVLAPTGDRSPLGAGSAEAGSVASQLVSLINQSRGAAGLRPVSLASDLSAVAQERANIIARDQKLSHTPNLGDRVCCWSWIGENVANGGSAGQVHKLFMGSAPHRANILQASADDVGIGVASAGGWIWVAEVFRARSDGSGGSSGGSGGGSGGSSGGSGSTGSGGDRTDGAASRDSDRVAPPPAALPGGTAAAPTAPRVTLRERILGERQRLRQERQQAKRWDALRSAVRYADTLAQVTPSR